MAKKWRLKGKDLVMRNLKRVRTAFPTAYAKAMKAELTIELNEAKARTPVDTGDLRKSGRIVGPNISGKSVEASIVFGNEKVSYAMKVHEDLEAYHPVGQAKYLESVWREAYPHLPKRIAKRINVEKLV